MGAANVTPMGNPVEGRTYYLQMMRWRAGSAATYVLIAIDWRTQGALRIVHFTSAQAIADALARPGALVSNEQRQAMLAALDSEHSSFVIRDIMLAGEQLDTIGLRPLE